VLCFAVSLIVGTEVLAMLGQVLVSSLLIAGCLLTYQTCMREAAAKRPGVLK
jgi:hypothetical protein